MATNPGPPVMGGKDETDVNRRRSTSLAAFCATGSRFEPTASGQRARVVDRYRRSMSGIFGGVGCMENPNQVRSARSAGRLHRRNQGEFSLHNQADPAGVELRTDN